MNFLPSLLSIFLCFNFLLYSYFDPSKIFSNAEKIRDGNNSKIKGMFVFGSSLLDNGNNNYLETFDKADYFPYGMDFPLGPSGRFTNGKNIIDVLGDLLKISTFVPAFNNLSAGDHADVGVNYASGGSGILDDTGSRVSGVLSLNQQIKKFEEVTLPEFENQGENSSRESLSKYLFVVGSGGKDYTYNYFLNKSQSSTSLQAFTDNLITTLSSQLKKLYSLGARKFVLMALHPLGCSPGSLAAQPQRKGCNKTLNNAVLDFNNYLKSLIKRLKPEMPGSNLVMVNAYKIFEEITKNPASRGFTDTTQPCCHVPSKAEGGNGILCKKGGSTCEDRNKHVYFDGMHPTEPVNVALARAGFSCEFTGVVYPFNIKELAQI